MFGSVWVCPGPLHRLCPHASTSTAVLSVLGRSACVYHPSAERTSETWHPYPTTHAEMCMWRSDCVCLRQVVYCGVSPCPARYAQHRDIETNHSLPRVGPLPAEALGYHYTRWDIQEHTHTNTLVSCVWRLTKVVNRSDQIITIDHRY